MNIQPPNYQQGYSQMGGLITRGASNLGNAIDSDIQKKKEREAYDQLMLQMKDFEKFKGTVADGIGETMVGESPKYVEKVKGYIKQIKDPKQLMAYSVAYDAQLKDFEKNKGIYKIRPQFGISSEEYKKQNDPFIKKAEEQRLKEQQRAIGEDVGAAVFGKEGTPEQTIPGERQPLPGTKNFTGMEAQNPEDVASGAVQPGTGVWGDMPGPTIIPAQQGIAPAGTELEAAGRIQDKSITQKQAESVPGYSAIGEQKKNDIRAQELELKKKRLDYVKSAEDRKNNGQALAWVKENRMERQFDSLQSTKLGAELNAATKEYVLKDSKLAEIEGEIEKADLDIQGLQQQQSDPSVQVDSEAMADLDKKMVKAIADKASLKQKAGALQDQLIKAEKQEALANAAVIEYLQTAQKKEKTTAAITKAKIEAEGSREVVATDAKGNKARVLIDSKGKIIKVIKEL